MGRKGEKLPGEFTTPAEVQQLLAQCRGGATGARNRALIALLAGSGLRTAEALSLKPSDVDTRLCRVRVLKGKGGKPREVALDPLAAALCEVWSAERKALGHDGRQVLFCTLEGRPLHSQYVRELVSRLGKQAGIPHRVHPHSLRHGHAVALLKSGADLEMVRAQLGHASLESTSVYLKHTRVDELADHLRAVRLLGMKGEKS